MFRAPEVQAAKKKAPIKKKQKIPSPERNPWLKESEDESESIHIDDSEEEIDGREVSLVGLVRFMLIKIHSNQDLDEFLQILSKDEVEGCNGSLFGLFASVLCLI